MEELSTRAISSCIHSIRHIIAIELTKEQFLDICKKFNVSKKFEDNLEYICDYGFDIVQDQLDFISFFIVDILKHDKAPTWKTVDKYSEEQLGEYWNGLFKKANELGYKAPEKWTVDCRWKYYNDKQNTWHYVGESTND